MEADTLVHECPYLDLQTAIEAATFTAMVATRSLGLKNTTSWVNINAVRYISVLQSHH